MILFKKIKYKNLLSSGNVFTEIPLNTHHSTLVIGDNGSGKSSVLDALSFVLYGKPFRKINKGMLVNSINGKGLLVEVEFQIGKKNYIVKRGIKPNIFEIYVEGDLLNQNAESREYQDFLEKNILKLNHKSFSQIVVLGSASFVPFMQLSAQHRREVIEDLLDIQIFSTMNTLLKEKVQINKNDISSNDYALKLGSEKIEMLKKHLESLKQNNEDLKLEKQQKINNLTDEINTLLGDASTRSLEVDRLNDLISDHDKVSKKLSKIRNLQTQIENKYSKLEKEIGFFKDNDNCPTCFQSINDEHKNRILSNNSDQLKEIQTAKEALSNEFQIIETRLKDIAVTNKEITDLNKAISDNNIRVQTLSRFIEGIRREIAELDQRSGGSEDGSTELANLKKELQDSISKKEELQKERQVLDVAALLLRDTGIKTKIIKQYVPIMNRLINKYLAAMDFFVNFELDENFQEKIKSRFRDEFTYDSFSEGEKMRIDLSLLFTWRAIAKLRNSASTNLLIMDEVFDSSLDGTGTDEFLKIISGLNNDTNIFIISHKGDQLVDKFSHTIKFIKHKNFSRIATSGE